MRRPFLKSLYGIGTTLLLLGCFLGNAAAQDGRPAQLSLMRQAAGFDEVAALFKRPAIPVRLDGLEGPDTLEVGAAGTFTAFANVDAATLPLRLRWDFGDGTTVETLHARHAFEAPGTYRVSFTIANRHGEAEDTLLVTVVPPAEATSAPGRRPDGDARARRSPGPGSTEARIQAQAFGEVSFEPAPNRMRPYEP